MMGRLHLYRAPGVSDAIGVWEHEPLFRFLNLLVWITWVATPGCLENNGFSEEESVEIEAEYQ